MGFNGSGTFNRLYNWVTDDGNGINIEASRMDGEDDGFATGLSNCITKDGQTTITANIPFNSKKITGLASGTARTDAINVGQVQDNSFGTLGTLGGSANTYTASPSPSITAYATGMEFNLKVNADNTGASTLNVSAVGAKDLKKYDGAGSKVALKAGDLQQDQYYKVIYDGTDFVVLLTDPATTTRRGAAYLSNPITIANNGTDANNDIDFSAGVMNFADGSGQAVATALTKQLDASWVAGTGAGGLFSGTKAVSTTYYCFSIYNSTTGIYDAGFDTSITAANAPSGYTKYERLFSFKTDSSGNIPQGTYFRNGNGYIFKFKGYQIDKAIGTQPTTPTLLTLASLPTGIELLAGIGAIVKYISASANCYALFVDYDYSNTTPSASNCTIYCDTVSSNERPTQNRFVLVKTNTSAQIMTNTVGTTYQTGVSTEYYQEQF